MAGVGASPVLGQRATVDLPPEDRVLTANFDEVFRVGEEDGERHLGPAYFDSELEWHAFGTVYSSAIHPLTALYCKSPPPT